MKWMPVTERLPDEGGRYWCYLSHVDDLGISRFQWNCCYNEDTKTFSDRTLNDGEQVTHWMPLPPIPDASLPSSSVTGEEDYEDEIYSIDDIDTIREMLIKQKKASYDWCKKAMEAANHRIQLQNEINELKVSSSTSPKEAKEIIAGILYKNKSDEGDEGCWINSEDFYMIADIIANKILAPVTGESEAIGFATFLEDGNFYKSEERGVRYYHNKEGKFTKPELFQKYKQSKK